VGGRSSEGIVKTIESRSEKGEKARVRGLKKKEISLPKKSI
jgi:hypothetical protein